MKQLDDLTEAEWQLVMMLRESPDDGLVIGITAEPGKCLVRMESPGIGRAIEGTGPDFSAAWDRAEPKG
jgi:hypothetical protein